MTPQSKITDLPQGKVYKVSPDTIAAKTIIVTIFAADGYTNDHQILLICATMGNIFEGEIDEYKAIRLFLQAMVFVIGRRALGIAQIEAELKDGGASDWI